MTQSIERLAANRLAGLREGVTSSIAATALILVLAPQALTITAEVGSSRRSFFNFLLLETVYILVGSACLGTLNRRGNLGVSAAILLALPAVTGLLSPILFKADVTDLLRSQAAAGATAVLGLGTGQMARGVCGRAGPAAALAMILVAAEGLSLLPISHTAPLLTSWPVVSEILLSANPFIAVTHGGGYDLIRSSVLYRELSLAGYQFRYPGALLPPLILTALGLALGGLGKWTEHPVRGATIANRSSSREAKA
jgi:hypothetical protein